MERLRKYCRYRWINEKEIEISKVYKPLYQIAADDRQIVYIGRVFNQFWNDNGLDTVDNLLKKIYIRESFRVYKESTIRELISAWLIKYYGYSTGFPGVAGNCYEVLCTEQDGRYEFLTTEQKKIFDFLVKKYFGDKLIEQMFIADAKQMSIYTLLNYDKNKELMFAEFKEITGLNLAVALSLVDFEDEEEEEEVMEQEIECEGVRFRM